MIILNNRATLEIVLGGAVTTNELPLMINYVDISEDTFGVSNIGRFGTLTNGTTAVTLGAAPPQGNQRQVKYLTIYNNDTVNADVTVQIDDTSNTRSIVTYTLGPGDTLEYMDSQGWNIFPPDSTLSFAGDSGSGVIDLDSETLTFAGGTAIATSASGNTVTAGVDINSATDLGSPATDDELLVGDISNADAVRKADIQTILALYDSQTATLTNKTITDISNSVDANDVRFEVRNESGATLTKGTPVYASGFNAGQTLIEVSEADASSISTMPAIGVVQSDIANSANGTVVAVGSVVDVDTSSFSNGDILYVSETAGGLTATPPTGTARVQRVAEVLRSNANNGSLQIINPGVVQDITGGELAQIQNIDTTTISGTQWSYLGSMDQGVSSSDNVSFNALDNTPIGQNTPAAVSGTTGDFSGILTAQDDIVMGTAGKGLDFSANGGDVLTQYEESGTFTPVLSDGTNNAASYSTQLGRYTRIGERVYVDIDIETTDLGSVSGPLRITGLPFTSSGAPRTSITVGSCRAMTLSLEGPVTGFVQSSATFIALRQFDSNGNDQSLEDTDWTANGSAFISASYRAS